MIPFYFIEYGFAQLGALQVARAASLDGLARYKESLAMGPEHDTASLFAAAGAQFIPTVCELMGWIREQIFDGH